MTKLAMDIVLLPSYEMMDKVIGINQFLLIGNENKIVLNKENCLPHISLCMGGIELSRMTEVTEVLKEIASNYSLFSLTANSLVADIIPTGKKVSGLHVEKTNALQSLHEEIMKKLWSFLSYDIEVPMLFNPGEVEEVSLSWIRNYKKKYYNPSLFQGHITVGFGETDQFKMPINFTAFRLAICQLGNYCTCRKIFAEFELK